MDIKKNINISLGKKTFSVSLWLVIVAAAVLLAAVLITVLLLLPDGTEAKDESSSPSEVTAGSEEESASSEEESSFLESVSVEDSTEEESAISENSSEESEGLSSEESEETESLDDSSEETAEELSSVTENSDEETEAPTESESQPVESESQPTESESQPTESESQPTESESQPAESESQPVESESQPTESESQSAESESQPAESESQPAESESQPVESESQPTESESQPTESESQPAESESQPAESESQPTESESQPVESESQPAESESQPAESESTPTETEPPEESSEDESSVIVDMNAPMNPLPETLATDPIDSYFNDSVFVGYSIMMHFGRYIGEWHSEIDPSIMGNPIFCAGVSISFYADRTQTPESKNCTLPLFRGQRYNFKDLPAATGCNNLYIGLMGYSDIRRSGVDGAYVETISGIQRILEANPNVNLVILACTYNTGNYSNSMPYSVNNGNILRYNNMVLDYCTSIGVDFVDVATPQTTYNGYLPMEYSSDEAYHIAKQAFYLWIDVLRDYAKKKQAGTWQNMTDMPSLPAFS